MKNPQQRMRYTDSELSLMKGLFAGNDALLHIIRKSLLQFNIEPMEAEILRGVMNQQVQALLRKVFLPELDQDAPLFQLTSMELALGADTKSLSPDGAWPFILAKDLEIDYIDQQLRIIEGKLDKPKIILSEMKNLKGPKTKREEIWVNITAWNFILSFVDSRINELKTLAGRKEESVEETVIRLAKDSSK